MQEYEINCDTLAILPTDDIKSLVIEKENEYVIDNRPFQVMDYSCQYFGSTYHGREEGSRSMIGVSYKAPVVVEETSEMIFFPTMSPQISSCSWIALREVKKIVDNKDGTTTVIFFNGREIIIPCSKHTMENQLLRATRLESVLRSRKRG